MELGAILGVSIPSVIVLIGAVIHFVRTLEHRLSSLEAKMDLVLKHNGINPDNGEKMRED